MINKFYGIKRGVILTFFIYFTALESLKKLFIAAKCVKSQNHPPFYTINNALPGFKAMLLFLFRLMNQENIYFRSINIMVWKAGMVAPPHPAPQKAGLGPPRPIEMAKPRGAAGQS